MKQATAKTATATKTEDKKSKGHVALAITSEEAPKPVLEEITPEIAHQYLEKNPKNRPIHQPTVKMYAKAMLDGEWKVTHQTIAFDKDGHLQDGQVLTVLFWYCCCCCGGLSF